MELRGGDQSHHDCDRIALQRMTMSRELKLSTREGSDQSLGKGRSVEG